MTAIGDLTIGGCYRIRFGGAIRPGRVESILLDGRVSVAFTDVTAEDARHIPIANRGHLFGAVVRPQAIAEAS